MKEQSPSPAVEFARRLALKEAAWKSLGVQKWSGGVPWRHVQTSRCGGPVHIHLAAQLLSPDAASRQLVIHVAEAEYGTICIAMVVIED